MQTLARYGLGADAPTNVPGVISPAGESSSLEHVLEQYEDFAEKHPMVIAVNRVVRTAAAVSGAFHGYRRNQSVGWSIGWFFLGAAFPLITTTVSVAQGYGKPRRP